VAALGPIFISPFGAYLNAWLNLRSWGEPSPDFDPASIRDRVDLLADLLDRASQDLRGIATRVEAEIERIASDLDDRLRTADIELSARAAKLEELTNRSMQYEQAAAMNQEQAEAVAQFFRLQVEEVSKSVEHSSRRREWGLAIFGFVLAVVAGVIVLPLAKWIGWA